MMVIKSLFGLLVKVFFFVVLLYGFVGFEREGLITYEVRWITLFIILSFALYHSSFKVKMNQIVKAILFIMVIFTALASTSSFGTDTFMLYFSLMFGSIVSSILIHNTKFHKQFLTALKWLIILSIVMLFVQRMIFIVTGEVLQIHEMFFPFGAPSRIEIYDFFQRMGGMYNEPGTYANWMYMFLIMYMILIKKKSSVLLYVGAFSIMFSFSIWGVAFGFYMILIMSFTKLRSSSIISKILATFIFLVSITSIANFIAESPFYQYVERKADNPNNASSGSKKQAYEKYQEKFDTFLIVGEGAFPEFKKGIHSLQDAGLFFNLSISLGIVCAVIIMLFYIISFFYSANWMLFFISLPIFFAKMYYWDPTFWLLLFMIISINGKKYKKIKSYNVNYQYRVIEIKRKQLI